MNYVRVMPPSKGDRPQIIVNGRPYVCLVGAFLDVAEADANQLTANKWTRVAYVGPTSARIPAPSKDLKFMDTSLGYIVVFDGTVWRNPATGAAV